MSPKKGYQKRLPTVLPPAPRREVAPDAGRPAPAEAPDAATARTTPPVPHPPVPPPRSARPAPDAAPRTQPAPAALPVEPPQPAPTTTADADPRRRRTVAGVLVVGIVALLAVVAAALVLLPGSDDEPGPAAETPAAAPTWLGAGESYVETRVTADGTMEVTQWIRGDEPISQLTLAVPRLSGWGDVVAQDVEVIADGRAAAGPTVVSYVGAYRLFDAKDVELRYTLVGGVERSDSAPGRALALATALDVRTSSMPEREVRVVRAAEVLSLACSPARGVTATPCGTSEAKGRWRVDLSGRRVRDRVVAALTLG